MRLRLVANLCALGALLVTGCGAEEDGAPASRATSPAAADRRQVAAPEPRVEPARCPAGLAGCRTATGTVVAVEAVDPDGDGDAHLVLASADSITAPGVSVIDVAAELRPGPLPRPGDAVSAAGPVYPGSFRQRQIEAVRLRVARLAPQPR